MFMKCRYHDTATSYAVYSRLLPARTGRTDTIRARDTRKPRSLAERAGRILNTRQSIASIWRRRFTTARSLVTMSRVRDGFSRRDVAEYVPHVTRRNLGELLRAALDPGRTKAKRENRKTLRPLYGILSRKRTKIDLAVVDSPEQMVEHSLE